MATDDALVGFCFCCKFCFSLRVLLGFRVSDDELVSIFEFFFLGGVAERDLVRTQDWSLWQWQGKFVSLAPTRETYAIS